MRDSFQSLRGYVLKGVSAAELRAIVRNVGTGDAHVTPRLAAGLLTEFSTVRPPDAFTTLTRRESGVLEWLSQG